MIFLEKVQGSGADGHSQVTNAVNAVTYIVKRTVQTLRSTGKLPYTRFNHKTYYKLEDVMKVLEEHKTLARKDEKDGATDDE